MVARRFVYLKCHFCGMREVVCGRPLVARTRERGTGRNGIKSYSKSMATCGIAAGARPVLSAFVEGVNNAGLNSTVTVSQTGCIGICQYEPVVEVFQAGKEKVTYVKMTAEKAAKVIEEHIKGGKVVEEYTYTYATKA